MTRLLPLKSLSQAILHCRLCWKITIGVFCAILAIEAGILFFSVQGYKQDRLAEIEREGMVVMRTIMRAAANDPGGLEAFPELAKMFRKNSVLLGAVLYRQGKRVSSFGQLPGLTLTDMAQEDIATKRYLEEEHKLDVIWPEKRFSDTFKIAARIDASELPEQVTGFIWRITGLVLLISVFVTIVTMLVLEKAILSPIRQLREQLDQASRDPNNPQKYQMNSSHQDEWGDVILSLNRLFEQSDVNLTQIKKQEQELVAHRDRLEELVTERTEKLQNALEKAEAASKAKSAFMANMSHELRTPLNSVIGFSDLLKQESLGPLGHPDYIDYAREMSSSSHRLLNLINMILDITQLESGDYELKEQQFDFERMLQTILRGKKETAEQANILLKLTGIDATYLVQGDEALFRRAVANIIENSITFSDAGNEVCLSSSYDQEKGLCLEIRDNGIGMKEEHISKIQESFGQISTSYSRGHEGAGLGLTLSKLIVNAHGGRILIESKEGVGTTVVLHFPPKRVQRYVSDTALKSEKSANSAVLISK
ncbi:MAG: HAMP domain-containing histidine kinase [Sneathiellales bacterium]|nr:HAMP domain-containing histidine kinase [Sneathiellales bacterium]